MLRNLLDKGKTVFENEKLKRFLPLFSAVDHFLYEAPLKTKRAPHIRDAVDVKRWMILVVIALFPCIIAAIWNTGLQKLVYSSGDYRLMQEYISASSSFSGYFSFVSGRVSQILWYGLGAFLPIMLISYIVGGFWEALFAIIRKHDISEGFLVSGMLYALILPPTLPYWMVAVGVSLGIVIGKEIFGGTGMNILNPALTCRCFLYFTYPAYMTGEIWAGTNSAIVSESLLKMNKEAGLSAVDAFSGASNFGIFNISPDIKRIHADAIAQHSFHVDTVNDSLIQGFLQKWSPGAHLEKLSPQEMQDFMTSAFEKGGLGLSPDNYINASKFVQLKYGAGLFSDGNLFFGNILGSMGEVSKLAIILGAFLLLITRIASWRTMLSFIFGMLFTAFVFQFGAKTIGAYHGAFNPAIFDFPIYKQFLMGSAAFGLVFMATDPVSSPGMRSSQFIYGFLIGALLMIVRLINPAYPEGVMLAILFGNVFSPLFDYYAVRFYRRRKRVRF